MTGGAADAGALAAKDKTTLSTTTAPNAPSSRLARVPSASELPAEHANTAAPSTPGVAPADGPTPFRPTPDSDRAYLSARSDVKTLTRAPWPGTRTDYDAVCHRAGCESSTTGRRGLAVDASQRPAPSPRTRPDHAVARTAFGAVDAAPQVAGQLAQLLAGSGGEPVSDGPLVVAAPSSPRVGANRHGRVYERVRLLTPAGRESPRSLGKSPLLASFRRGRAAASTVIGIRAGPSAPADERSKHGLIARHRLQSLLGADYLDVGRGEVEEGLDVASVEGRDRGADTISTFRSPILADPRQDARPVGWSTGKAPPCSPR